VPLERRILVEIPKALDRIAAHAKPSGLRSEDIEAMLDMRGMRRVLPRGLEKPMLIAKARSGPHRTDRPD
jgi:hypothetical protein